MADGAAFVAHRGKQTSRRTQKASAAARNDPTRYRAQHGGYLTRSCPLAIIEDGQSGQTFPRYWGVFMEDEMLTIGQAAKELGVTTRTLRRWGLLGRMNAFRPPRASGKYSQRRYSRAEVNRVKNFLPTIHEVSVHTLVPYDEVTSPNITMHDVLDQVDGLLRGSWPWDETQTQNALKAAQALIALALQAQLQRDLWVERQAGDERGQA